MADGFSLEYRTGMVPLFAKQAAANLGFPYFIGLVAGTSDKYLVKVHAPEIDGLALVDQQLNVNISLKCDVPSILRPWEPTDELILKLQMTLARRELQHFTDQSGICLEASFKAMTKAASIVQSLDFMHIPPRIATSTLGEQSSVPAFMSGSTYSMWRGTDPKSGVDLPSLAHSVVDLVSSGLDGTLKQPDEGGLLSLVMAAGFAIFQSTTNDLTLLPFAKDEPGAKSMPSGTNIKWRRVTKGGAASISFPSDQGDLNPADNRALKVLLLSAIYFPLLANPFDFIGRSIQQVVGDWKGRYFGLFDLLREFVRQTFTTIPTAVGLPLVSLPITSPLYGPLAPENAFADYKVQPVLRGVGTMSLLVLDEGNKTTAFNWVLGIGPVTEREAILQLAIANNNLNKKNQAENKANDLLNQQNEEQNKADPSLDLQTNLATNLPTDNPTNWRTLDLTYEEKKAALYFYNGDPGSEWFSEDAILQSAGGAEPPMPGHLLATTTGFKEKPGSQSVVDIVAFAIGSDVFQSLFIIDSTNLQTFQFPLESALWAKIQWDLWGTSETESVQVTVAGISSGLLNDRMVITLTGLALVQIDDPNDLWLTISSLTISVRITTLAGSATLGFEDMKVDIPEKNLERFGLLLVIFKSTLINMIVPQLISRVENPLNELLATISPILFQPFSQWTKPNSDSLSLNEVNATVFDGQLVVTVSLPWASVSQRLAPKTKTPPKQFALEHFVAVPPGLKPTPVAVTAWANDTKPEAGTWSKKKVVAKYTLGVDDSGMAVLKTVGFVTVDVDRYVGVSWLYVNTTNLKSGGNSNPTSGSGEGKTVEFPSIAPKSDETKAGWKLVFVAQEIVAADLSDELVKMAVALTAASDAILKLVSPKSAGVSLMPAALKLKSAGVTKVFGMLTETATFAPGVAEPGTMVSVFGDAPTVDLDPYAAPSG